MPMRTISYNSIRLTLLQFKQRRVALVHGTKMLVLLLLAGFSWQSVVANITAGTRVGNSPAHNISGKNKPAAISATFWTTVQLLTATPGANEVQGNDEIRYTVHIQNTGTDPITALRFVDSIPVNTTFSSAQFGVTPVAGVLIYNAGALAVGGSTTFSFTVSVNNPVLPTVSYIRHTSYLDLGDLTLLPAPAVSGGTPPVYPVYAINTPVDNGMKAVAWKTQQYAPTGPNGYVQAADTIRYNIWVRNTGTIPLTNVLVSDYVPSYTGFVSALEGGTKDVNDMVSWTIPSIPVGQQALVSFVVRVAQDLTGASAIENTAQVDINNGKPAFNTVPGDATGLEPSPIPTSGPSTSIPIKSVTAFETWKLGINDNDPNSTTIGPGEDITYYIYVRNTGNISIAALTINDLIPTGTTFKSVRDGGAYNESASGDAHTVDWQIDNIAAGAIAVVHFTVTVDEHVEGLKNISNVAKVQSADTIIYTIGCDPNEPGCDRTKKGTVIPLAGTRADLFVSNVLTPNNDGLNDRFIVRGIEDEKYRGSTLHIYNRWGNEVYQSKDYQNTWTAAGLSEGTYYYILELKNAGTIKEYKGWVMIIR